MSFTDNWFLGALPSEDLRRLEPHLRAVRYSRGQVLCEPGQQMETLYFFRVGMSSDVQVLRDGFEVEVCAFGYESGFGLGAALGPVQALTRDLCQVPGDGWQLPAAAFREAYARSDGMKSLVLRHTQAVISFMAQSLACNTRHSLEARLSRWLLTAADHAEGENLDVTHEFLAIMLGSTRSNVTLGLGEMQRQGLVTVARGAVALVDREALGRRSCECYQVTRETWATLRPGADGAVAGV